MNRPDNPLIQRANALGLPLVERAWVPSSRLALAANEAVRAHGLGTLNAFHSAVNRRYWAQGEDISQWPTLEAAAQDVGLDGAAMRRAVVDGGLDEKVEQAITQAHRIGIHAVPTYVFFDADRPVAAIQGAQEWSAFERAARQLGLSPR